MIRLIARVQITRAVRDLRFITFAFLIMGLSGLAGIVYGTAYNEKAEFFHSRQAVLWNNKSIKTVTVGKPPSPLCLVAEGHEANLPMFMRIEPDYVDDRGGLAKPGSFLFRSQHLDWMFVFGTLGSLLAIVFTFDACNGERDRGTLRLCLSSPIRRSSFLLGKYIGVMTVITIPIAAGALLDLAFFFALVPSAVEPGRVVRIALALVLILIFLSLWVALGLMMSCICRRPVTSVLFLFFAWVLFLMLIPQSSGVLAGLVNPIVSKAELEPRMELVRQQEVTGLTANCWRRMSAVVESDISEAEKITRLRRLSENISAEQEDNLRKCRRQLNSIKDGQNRARARQTRLAQSVASLSPLGLLSLALENLASTGYPRYDRFRSRAEAYMREYTSYVDLLKDEYRDQAVYMDSASGGYKGYEFKIRSKLSYDSVDFDYGAFPSFYLSEPPLGEACADAARSALILLILNVLAFAAAYVAFRSFDVR